MKHTRMLLVALSCAVFSCAAFAADASGPPPNAGAAPAAVAAVGETTVEAAMKIHMAEAQHFHKQLADSQEQIRRLTGDLTLLRAKLDQCTKPPQKVSLSIGGSGGPEGQGGTGGSGGGGIGGTGWY